MVETVNDERAREKESSLNKFYNFPKLSLESGVGGEGQPENGE